MPSDSGDKGLPQQVTELWAMTKEYARQETIDPLKGLARYAGFGFLGAVMGAMGIILLLLGLLRALQTETGDALDGNMSWAPYMIVLIVGVLIAAIAFSRTKK